MASGLPREKVTVNHVNYRVKNRIFVISEPTYKGSSQSGFFVAIVGRRLLAEESCERSGANCLVFLYLSNATARPSQSSERATP